MKSALVYPIPLDTNPYKRLTPNRFRFLNSNGDKLQTAYISYRPAKIYRGKKWFIYYSFRHEGKFHRFKVYEDINRVPLSEREAYAKTLRDAVNEHLKKGFDPFEQELKIEVRNWTLVQGLNYWKQNVGSRGLRERSVKLYGTALDFLYKYLTPVMNEDINKITKANIQTAFRKAQTERKWTNSTYNNYITFTRTIFNFLVHEEILTVNPCKVKPLPENFKRHKPFSKEVWDKISKNAEPDLLDFLMFQYHTAIRPNEAMQLYDSDFLLDRKILHVKSSVSKTNKERFVPLTDYVVKNYSTRKGKLFDYKDRYFSRKFSKLKRTLKLSMDYTMYSIKPTRALHLVEDGVSIYFIMQLFGHSNPMTTMAYLRDIGASVDMNLVEKGIKF